MNSMQHFLSMLSEPERSLFTSLDSPPAIQAFLDSTPYSTDERNRSPLSVLRDGVAHCLDGALFACAALRYLGEPTVVTDLQTEPGVDDDHVLVLFRRNGHLGAMAKSNFPWLRFREPVYRNLRELVMTFFEPYFSMNRQKTLRYYTFPLNLKRFDRLDWLWQDEAASAIETHLSQSRRVALLDADMAQTLQPVDELTFQAGTLGVNPEGLYKPKH
jgi:hypothetical protein